MYFNTTFSRFPSLGYFRNGEYLKFKGDLKNEKSVLKWLTSDKAIMLSDQIEEVNGLMLSKVIISRKITVIIIVFNIFDIISAKRFLFIPMQTCSCFYARSRICLYCSTTTKKYFPKKYFVGWKKLTMNFTVLKVIQ